MSKLVECVPNFSEGRDKAKIQQITSAIERVKGVSLLDVDPGYDTNRTVVTLIGSPEAVAEAAFVGIKTASEVLDMSGHKGAHARMGATDVCPFVPVAGVSMEECSEIARKVGKRVGEELSIPVYLYENAATSEERRNLAVVRAGEYEGLEEKLKNPEWKPDFGKAEFNRTAGATAVGARQFLIAYNVNLNTRDRKLANDIALTIREKGRAKRDANGKIMRDENGVKLIQDGLLQECKATGWYMDEFGQAQVSMNLTNYHVTPIHVAIDTIRSEAIKRGVEVTGSELVGLLPREALLMAGKYYLEKQKRSPAVSEKELVHIAIKSMGLCDVAPFDPDDKIIENRIEKPGPLVSLTLDGFAEELASDSPAPGGGSVAALAGAIGSSLAAMVGALTYGKKGYEEHAERMATAATSAHVQKKQFILDVDRDTDAFNLVMAAMKSPKAERAQKIEDATKQATMVPFSVLERCLAALPSLEEVVDHGNRNSLSDAGVGAGCIRLCAEGALMNVKINLPGIEDRVFRKETLSNAEAVFKEVCERCSKMLEKVHTELDGQVKG